MSSRRLKFGLFKISLLLALIPGRRRLSQNIFQLDLVTKKVTMPYFLHPLEKWFTTYFELALSRIMPNFIV